MKSAFIKYFFLFLILLLSGYQGIYALSYAHSGGYSPSSFSSFDTHNPIAKAGSIDQAGLTDIDLRTRLLAEVIEAEEEVNGEEGIGFTPKKIQLGGFLTVLFYLQLCAELLTALLQHLRQLKPFFLKAPFRRYVRFQVFRI